MIRPAGLADLVALTALARSTYTAAFGFSFTPDDLTAHFARELSEECFVHALAQDVILVAEAEEALVGFVQFGPTAEAGTAELRRLYVMAPFQNQKIGSRLMECALAHPSLQAASRVVLDVWEQNPGALRFYQRYGFVVVGSRAFAVASGAPTTADLILERTAPRVSR